jgi:hypothetical protein
MQMTPPTVNKIEGKTETYASATGLHASESMQGPYGGMHEQGQGTQEPYGDHAEHTGQKNISESNGLDGKTARPRMTPHGFDTSGQGGPFDLDPSPDTADDWSFNKEDDQ